MKIAIVGYGKMGKEIEKKAIQLGHFISFIIDKDNSDDFEKILPSNTDVIIEFTQPGSVIHNIQKSFSKKIPIITGTTGWYDKMEEITSLCKNQDGTLFYAPNFSLGVNLSLEFSRVISAKLSKFPGYDVHIEETHHTQKLDSPSGTAIAIANNILPNHKNFTSWKNSKDSLKTELPIISHRISNVTGKHTLFYESESDIIELVHEAKNRSGFAIGAILAAEFVLNKKGVFTMPDFLKYKFEFNN
jgi:4-hydroxy-tetrahydrodipicolinate reductase